MPKEKNNKSENRKEAAKSSAVSAPSISLPKGGGAIRGIGEKFAANPVTGTGTFSVPIAVTPGRSGFSPQLSLSYDSGSGNRTPGMSRKYFFRRYEYGYWTPWEKVDLDIEDNPILPVVWKGRLLLFWLNIMRKGPEDQKLPESDSAGLNPNQLEGAKEKIEINLSWSEYYNKKWQPK